MGRFARTVKRNSSATDTATYSNLNDVEAAKRFPELVREAGLYWWSLDDTVQTSEIKVVFGVCTWCGYDMHRMDCLEEAGPQLREKSVRVEIFDMDGVWHTVGDFNRCVPGITETQPFTPIVGIWENGVLTEKASGYKGRELVYDFLHSITGRDLRLH